MFGCTPFICRASNSPLYSSRRRRTMMLWEEPVIAEMRQKYVEYEQREAFGVCGLMRRSLGCSSLVLTLLVWPRASLELKQSHIAHAAHVHLQIPLPAAAGGGGGGGVERELVSCKYLQRRKKEN